MWKPSAGAGSEMRFLFSPNAQAPDPSLNMSDEQWKSGQTSAVSSEWVLAWTRRHFAPGAVLGPDAAQDPGVRRSDAEGNVRPALLPD